MPSSNRPCASACSTSPSCVRSGPPRLKKQPPAPARKTKPESDPAAAHDLDRDRLLPIRFERVERRHRAACSDARGAGQWQAPQAPAAVGCGTGWPRRRCSGASMAT